MVASWPASWMGPCLVRNSTIARACSGPMPGSSRSSAGFARLTRTLFDMSASSTSDRVDDFRVHGQAARLNESRPPRTGFDSDHVRDVGGDRGVGVEHVLEVVGAGAEADAEREDVDDLVGVGAQEVGAEDAAAAFLDQHLRSRRGFPCPL